MLRQREHLVAFIVWFQTILRICSGKWFCWFIATCESIIFNSILSITNLTLSDWFSILENSFVLSATFAGIGYDIFSQFLDFHAFQLQLLRHVLTIPTSCWCCKDMIVEPVKSPIYSYPLQVTRATHETVLVVKSFALGTKIMKTN